MDGQLNQAPCGFLTLSEDGIILSINQTLLQILNYNHTQLKGQHVNSILTVPARLFFQFYFFPLVKMEHHVEEMYVSLESSQQKEIPVLINAVQRQDKAGTNIECILIPMRKRNEYENALLIAKKEAEAALKAKHQAFKNLEDTLKMLEMKKEELVELNKQNQTYKIETKKELELAGKIQQKLLTDPIMHEQIQMEVFYKASNELSGDIYGIYQIDQHRYGIILLDVMGHGVSSAMITMSLHSLFQRYITLGLPVDFVMKELDHQLHELFQNNEEARHYCTAVFLLIDTEQKKIDYLNAGHPSPLWQDANGQQIELHSTVPPLGTFEGMIYQPNTFSYQQGGRILLYTDGVDPLGTDYLSPLLRKNAALPLPHFKEVILHSLANEENTCHKRDDQCFILVDLT